MKTSKLFYGMALLALMLGFASCSDDDDADALDLINVIEGKGMVGSLEVDFFLSDVQGVRKASFGAGEDFVFNVVLTNTSDEETADWGFVQDTFSIYGADLRYVGKQWDEWLTTMNMKWIFPGDSHVLKVSWLNTVPSYGDSFVQKSARKPLPAGTYYTVATVKAGGETKTFLVKFDVR